MYSINVTRRFDGGNWSGDVTFCDRVLFGLVSVLVFASVVIKLRLRWAEK